MKKLFVVLAILFIGILLAGCTSKPAAPATTVATPAPTTVAVTAATPAPVVTKEVVVIKKNETANVTAAPTTVPTVPSVTITFTQDMTVVPGVTVYVPVGGKVIWKNDDPLKPHGIQAIDNTLGQKYFGGMNTITIPYGKTYEVTFDIVGAYDYTTVFQPQTIGKIIVTK